MDKDQSGYYRQRASDLRAYAERSTNFSIRYELFKAADNYDQLADHVEKEPLPTSR